MLKLENAIHQEFLRVKGIQAYGTPEGVTKAWDSRGRGRKAVQSKDFYRPGKRPHRFPEPPKPEAFAQKFDENMKKPAPVLTPKQQEVQDTAMRAKWQKLADQAGHAAMLMDDPEKVQSAAGKFLHFINQWGDKYANVSALADLTKLVRDVVITGYIAGYTAFHVASTHLAQAGNLLTWAISHLAPVMNHTLHIATASGHL